MLEMLQHQEHTDLAVDPTHVGTNQVHVIINNCGHIEQAKLTSVRFTPAQAWQRVGTPEIRSATPQPPFEIHQLVGFLVLIFETNPLEGPTCVLTSCADLIWDFVLNHTTFSGHFSLLLGVDGTVGLKEMCPCNGKMSVTM